MCVDRFGVFVFSLTTVLLAAGQVTAGDSHCARCGGSGPCKKVCRPVTEEKSISITCWGCKCEEFCLPGPSKPGCEQCEMVCGTCEACRGGNAVRSQAQPLIWSHWIPGSAKVHAKKKLMKKTITKKVPSHKWVVEELCDHCAQDTQTPSVTLNILAGSAPSP